MQFPREARWWHLERDGRVRCDLCPRACRMGEGQAGFCYVRRVRDGKLVSSAYGRPTGFAADPMEKKPLNHYLPGTSTLSFGTAGCNLGCRFCQNWSTSKARTDDARSAIALPDDVVELAVRQGCASISYTYNDPVVFAEFAVDVARAARARGVSSVAVTAGYVTEAARAEFFENIAAANVDLKAFTEDFYRKLTFSHLQPVLDTLVWLKRSTKVWFEIANLVVPGANDDEDEIRSLARWMRHELGPDVPLHFTAFHPDFKLRDRPRTPSETLARARQLALREGLHYVYTGNVHDRQGGTTFCPRCKDPLIVRDWFDIVAYRLRGNECGRCGAPIAGVFPEEPVRPGSARRRVLRSMSW